MERTCNSCKCHNACPECLAMSEDQKDELSCQKYQPMLIHPQLGGIETIKLTK